MVCSSISPAEQRKQLDLYRTGWNSATVRPDWTKRSAPRFHSAARNRRPPRAEDWGLKLCEQNRKFSRYMFLNDDWIVIKFHNNYQRNRISRFSQVANFSLHFSARLLDSWAQTQPLNGSLCEVGPMQLQDMSIRKHGMTRKRQNQRQRLLFKDNERKHLCTVKLFWVVKKK